MRTILDKRRVSVHTHAMQFAHRMKATYPDLWLSFKAKQRVLGIPTYSGVTE